MRSASALACAALVLLACCVGTHCLRQLPPAAVVATSSTVDTTPWPPYADAVQTEDCVWRVTPGTAPGLPMGWQADLTWVRVGPAQSKQARVCPCIRNRHSMGADYRSQVAVVRDMFHFT